MECFKVTENAMSTSGNYGALYLFIVIWSQLRASISIDVISNYRYCVLYMMGRDINLFMIAEAHYN